VHALSTTTVTHFACLFLTRAVLFFLFLFAAAFQFFCWSAVLRASYRRGVEPDQRDPASGTAAVSVIVCFHNEQKTLGRCVDRILAQVYPGELELVLVDDNSTDNSASIIHLFEIKHDNVRLLQPGPTRAGKKDALAFGIAAAKHDFLVLTDADCVPASSHWLWFMADPLRRGTELVLGVSPYTADKENALLSAWQRFEATYVSLKYLGFARTGMPYMGVGRNLAYRRSFYERAGGFAAHADLPGGDDDLLVSATAQREGTARVVHPAAWTYSAPQPSWRAYFRQRARHQSVGIRYPAKAQWVLGGLALSHGLFYLLGFYLLFTPDWLVALGAYTFRLLLLIYVYATPYLGADAGARSPDWRSAPAPEGGGWRSKVSLPFTVAFFDAWVGPMYLYLAVAGLRPARSW